MCGDIEDFLVNRQGSGRVTALQFGSVVMRANGIYYSVSHILDIYASMHISMGEVIRRSGRRPEISVSDTTLESVTGLTSRL